MIKFLLADEDFNQKVIPLLRDAGYDITSIKDLGLDRQWFSDNKVLELAIEKDRIILTHNWRDFKKLHAQVETHPGILACFQTSDYIFLAERIQQHLSEQETFRSTYHKLTKA
ncbi:DUF5615 family PIN-like protein [Neolewinella antarctica]|uniref:Nuclease of putative toxin-antitoxin system n=1 Tax=Neolewinella antarctica TaxID=442734 RepID=A0ABX0XFG0_9BACT|nr:DUF5615 family PIN-like protein [Neolewinella antarctica]NJC27614.1 putative nuclease of putative toxin-antitoxin system [Neolewinella antarctica]